MLPAHEEPLRADVSDVEDRAEPIVVVAPEIDGVLCLLSDFAFVVLTHFVVHIRSRGELTSMPAILAFPRLLRSSTASM